MGGEGGELEGGHGERKLTDLGERMGVMKGEVICHSDEVLAILIRVEDEEGANGGRTGGAGEVVVQEHCLYLREGEV